MRKGTGSPKNSVIVHLVTGAFFAGVLLTIGNRRLGLRCASCDFQSSRQTALL